MYVCMNKYPLYLKLCSQKNLNSAFYIIFKVCTGIIINVFKHEYNRFVQNGNNIL